MPRPSPTLLLLGSVAALAGASTACSSPSPPASGPTTVDGNIVATCRALLPALGPNASPDIGSPEALTRLADAYRDATPTAPTDLKATLENLSSVAEQLASAGGTTSGTTSGTTAGTTGTTSGGLSGQELDQALSQQDALGAWYAAWCGTR